MSLCGFDADVCSSALLIPAILGCGRTEPPLKPLSEFAEPALFANGICDSQRVSRCDRPFVLFSEILPNERTSSCLLPRRLLRKVVVDALSSLRKGGVVAINAIHLDQMPATQRVFSAPEWCSVGKAESTFSCNHVRRLSTSLFGFLQGYIAAPRLRPRMSSKNGVLRCCTHSAAYKYIAADQVCQSRPLGLPVCA